MIVLFLSKRSYLPGMNNYGIVRYLYSLDKAHCQRMQGTNQTIMQDFQILRKSGNVQSSVSKVECYVCGKGIQDGHSITAKTLPHGIVLFCDVHYSLQNP